jgi:hypothetical protein
MYKELEIAGVVRVKIRAMNSINMVRLPTKQFRNFHFLKYSDPSLTLFFWAFSMMAWRCITSHSCSSIKTRGEIHRAQKMYGPSLCPVHSLTSQLTLLDLCSICALPFRTTVLSTRLMGCGGENKIATEGKGGSWQHPVLAHAGIIRKRIQGIQGTPNQGHVRKSNIEYSLEWIWGLQGSKHIMVIYMTVSHEREWFVRLLGFCIQLYPEVRFLGYSW